MLFVELFLFQAEDLDTVLKTGVLLLHPIKVLLIVNHADFLLMQVRLRLA